MIKLLKTFLLSYGSFSKRDISILIGNAIDHFDTALYAFLAPVFAKIFFPNYNLVVGLILAYSLLISSLVSRPIGSYLFGSISRKYGAIVALSYSLIGVAISTIIIGLTPSYEQIGCLAPLLLVVFRVFQGICSEGESAVAKLYILENKLARYALKSSYLYETSTMVGIILASLISTIIIQDEFSKYWRICFIIGGAVAFIGYFLRNFEHSNKENHIDVCSNKGIERSIISDGKLIWREKFGIMRVSFASGFSYMTYAMPIFMNSFVPMITDVSLEAMMRFTTILLVLDMVMIPIIGRITERFAFKKVLNVALITMIFSITLLLVFLNNSSIWYIIFVQVWIITIGVIFLCPLNYWYNTLFTGNEKYMLVGIGNSIGSSLIGRLTPSICFILWNLTGSLLSIAIYVILISVTTLWAINIREK